MLHPTLAVDWPLIVFPALAISGLLTLGWLWLRQRSHRGRVERQLAEFKERVVRSGDVMDHLREQHRSLPAVDADFLVPMEGATRAEYEAIQDVLDRYRDRWLELMDLWDRVRELMESAGTGRVARLQQASELLSQAGQLEQLAALESECQQRISRLADAHEAARRAAQQVETLSESLIECLQELGESGYATDAYQTDMDAVVEFTDDGVRQIDPDPLGAIQTLARAQAELQTLIGQVQDVLAAEQRAAELDARRDQQARRIAAMRTEGYLFSEPDAAPQVLQSNQDELLEELRRHLDRGSLESAHRALESLLRVTGRLDALLDTCEDMRRNSQDQLATGRSALRRLLDEANAAEVEARELERQYPPEAWRRTVENLDATRGAIAALHELLDQAEAAIADDTQHYIRARRLMDEVQARQPELHEATQAVGRKRRQLDAIRASCQERIHRVESLADRVGLLLQQSRADRDLCNNRYRMARERLQSVLQGMQDEPADWPRIADRVEQCVADFERVEQLAQQDIALFRQAEAEIAEAERAIRKARGFYRAGVSADTSRAAGLELDARRALANQDYERAILHANEAEQAARDARSDAREMMEQLERKRDRTRGVQRQAQIRSVMEMGAAAAARALREMTRR